MSDELRVYIRHARPMCAKGIRTWLESYGFSVRDAVLHGIPLSQLEKTQDLFALQACKNAIAEVNHGEK